MKKIVNFIRNNKLGSVTLSLSLAYMLLGLPSQIFQIWKTKNVEGVSLFAFALLGIQSFFWVLYARQKKDWFVTIANVFGFIFAAIIVVEYLMLRGLYYLENR